MEITVYHSVPTVTFAYVMYLFSVSHPNLAYQQLRISFVFINFNFDNVSVLISFLIRTVMSQAGTSSGSA